MKSLPPLLAALLLLGTRPLLRQGTPPRENQFCHSPAPVWLSLAIIAWGGKITDAIDGTFMEVDYVRISQARQPWITPRRPP